MSLVEEVSNLSVRVANEINLVRQEMASIGGVVETGSYEGSSYSTTEQVTENRWIDGKPIYRKVISANFGTVINDIFIASGLTNEEYVAIKDFYFSTTDGRVWTSASSTSTTDTNENWCYYDKVNHRVYMGVSDGWSLLNNVNCYITLEYTKTTDTNLSPVRAINTHSSVTPNLFIQPTEPILPNGSSALWLQTNADGTISLYLKEVAL